MKRLTFIIACIVVALSAQAKKPETGFKKFYNQYHNYANATSFKIPAGLASFFIDDEEQDVKAFMDGMDDIHFLVFESFDKQLLIDLNRHLSIEDYKEMMTIKDGSSEVIFLAMENENIIEEIVMTVVSDNELVVMCIAGDISKETAKKMVKSIDFHKATTMNQ